MKSSIISYTKQKMSEEEYEDYLNRVEDIYVSSTTDEIDY